MELLAKALRGSSCGMRPVLERYGVVGRVASVLLLLLPGKTGPEVLFQVRSPKLDWQPGDICFPGGKREPYDHNFAAAAVRESWEELGLHPENIQLCGTLDFFAAHNGFMVYPFVGIWQPDVDGGEKGVTDDLKKSEDAAAVISNLMTDAKSGKAVYSQGCRMRRNKGMACSEQYDPDLKSDADSSEDLVYPDYKNWEYNKDEVEDLFTVPLEYLLKIEPKTATMDVRITYGDDFPYELVTTRDKDWELHKDYKIYFYRYEDKVIWGMTAHILHSFIKKYGEVLKKFIK